MLKQFKTEKGEGIIKEHLKDGVLDLDSLIDSVLRKASENALLTMGDDKGSFHEYRHKNGSVIKIDKESITNTFYERDKRRG